MAFINTPAGASVEAITGLHPIACCRVVERWVRGTVLVGGNRPRNDHPGEAVSTSTSTTTGRDTPVARIAECCAPLIDKPLDEAQAATVASWFKVLSDPTRLRLLSLITSKGEACAACDLVEPIGLSQPTVSHHLQVLFKAGLVEREKRGRWVYYRPVPENLSILCRALIG